MKKKQSAQPAEPPPAPAHLVEKLGLPSLEELVAHADAMFEREEITLMTDHPLSLALWTFGTYTGGWGPNTAPPRIGVLLAPYVVRDLTWAIIENYLFHDRYLDRAASGHAFGFVCKVFGAASWPTSRISPLGVFSARLHFPENRDELRDAVEWFLFETIREQAKAKRTRRAKK